VRRFHQSMCAHRFFKGVLGTMLRNVLQSRPASPYSSSLSTFGRSSFRTGLRVNERCLRLPLVALHHGFPHTRAVQIGAPTLRGSRGKALHISFSRLVSNKRRWRRRLQGTDTALQIRKPPKGVGIHIGKGRRARLTRSMRTRTK
jgi:hypothetical protein